MTCREKNFLGKLFPIHWSEFEYIFIPPNLGLISPTMFKLAYTNVLSFVNKVNKAF